MVLRRTLVSLSFSVVASAALVTGALAQQTNCPGKDLLEELKAKDAAAYTRVRAAAEGSKNGKALLWKIEHPDFLDRPASYLFGTINVTDERAQKLSPATEEALSFSRRIAFDVEDMSDDRTNEALGVMQNALLPSANDRLYQMLAKPEAIRARFVLGKSNLPKEWHSRVQPWVAMVMAATSECERQRMKAGKLLQEGEIARQAENRGVGSFGLESAEVQLSAFAELSEAHQLSLLKASLAAYERLDDQNETLVQLYLKRDVGALWPMLAELAKINGADPEALEAVRQGVLDDRNIRMRDRTLMHLAYGGVFFAVGAMHLPGEKGLVELFKDAGYTLTPVE